MRKTDDPRVIARFWAKVDVVEDNDSCWLWTAGVWTHGYGLFTINSKALLAHRYAYSIANGEIPPGFYCLHRCDTLLCCRPSHLFIGTQADNMADAMAKDRICKGDRHHWRLHPEDIPRGSKTSNAVLTAAQVREIRRIYSTKPRPTQRDLADQYRVGKSTIYAIINRKSWGHLV